MARRRKKSSPYVLFGAVGAAATLGLLIAAVWWLKWSWPLGYLGGINGATFMLYGVDKMAARLQARRVPEGTLHLFAFAGGTPCAYLGQKVFRHKTRKGSFRRLFFLLAFLQLALIVWVVWMFGVER